MNRFSFSVVISFQPKRLRRDSTSLLEIPCLMSASSHSSGTTPGSPPVALEELPERQNCHQALPLPASAASAAWPSGVPALGSL